MSFPSGPVRFRETLKHEDHIHNQIEVCRQALNRGDTVEVMNAVECLLTLVTPNMEDVDFLADLEEADADWKAELAKRKREFNRDLQAAGDGCPDVLSKPSDKPGIDHWKRVYMIALGLFERKKLMLREDTSDQV